MIFLALRPISQQSLEDAALVEGCVESIIVDQASGDIELSLEDHDTHYYLNRGIQNGIDPIQLKALKGRLIS